MPSIEPNVKDVIESTDWKEITLRLTLFTVKRLYWLGWHGPSVRVPKRTFKEPTDYVHEAITKFLAGERNWDPSRTSLFQFLCGVVSSLISHDVNNRLETSIDDVISQEDSDRWQISTPSSKQDFDHQRKEVLERLRDDPLASQIAELILSQGIYKSSELADALGINVKEVHNAKRRMRRALVRWRTSKHVQ